MLTRLSIWNYALIDELSVTFGPGLNIITGETGAGKSIVLGALSLILGARADTTIIRNSGKKCIVEGLFHLPGDGLESFFTSNDLDFDVNTILRREISPSGKSRAFINDTPVNLQQLRDLSLQLIDIHSQFQNLDLGSRQFQIKMVDIVSGNQDLLRDYQSVFSEHNRIAASLKSLREKSAKAKADLDYYQFQYDQLEKAGLEEDEQELLEEEREKLVHSEDIKSTLAGVHNLLEGDHFPVLSRLKDALGRLDKIRSFIREAGEFYDRMDNVYVELRELTRETGILAENILYDPQRLVQVNERLDLIYSLQLKHQVSEVAELIELKNNLAGKISEIAGYDPELLQLEKKLTETGKQLHELADKLTRERVKSFPVIQQRVTSILIQLAIPNAVFVVEHNQEDTFTPLGTDDIHFLFSANKNVPPAEISYMASGGEISRVMLALKSLLADSYFISTIILDEIDSGISGEAALKMGAVLRNLSKGVQVINITHLPQIAAQGDEHFLVYKTESGTGAVTSVRKLREAERIDELAKMMGGDDPSETTRKTATELLKKDGSF